MNESSLYCKPQLSRRRFVGSSLLFSSASLLGGCVARAESDIVLYCALDEVFARPIVAAFERSTENEIGVVAKYDVESTKTVGLVNQIIAEQQSPVCDVFWNNEIMHTVRLQKLGLLKPRNWDVAAGWPSDMIASDGTWCGFAARARVLLVNTDKLPNKADRPTSVMDLADPKWKDNCAMARPLFGTTATHFAVLREKDGHDETIGLLEKIHDNAVILSGNKQVAQAVASGQVAWGLTDTDDAVIEKDNLRKVEIVFPDQQVDQPGAMRIPNTLSILKSASHPIASEQFADYIVSAAIEDRLAMGDSSQLPISRDSKFTPRVMPKDPVRWMKVDFEAAAEDWESWAKELMTIFEE
ncbi:extracellular solute-binding protein [Rhodopirellula sp. MGV]|uniref:extracellular solute-binding protein n=1 Tax=Rhodopirellula sp. MGV TaxID=2023130 RepID=UPI000B969E3D|nr:extracellular solute-binding protein [Rhodopirellula sp. MGV]OYP36962.1 iron transporter [Rhodopirellula sp. MGV]PNY36276.1 iron transporter [Rhodopirellula baltica]